MATEGKFDIIKICKNTVFNLRDIWDLNLFIAIVILGWYFNAIISALIIFSFPNEYTYIIFIDIL